jgi:hypothetical protein
MVSEKTSPAGNGKAAAKQRYSAGYLPAIPFEVTGP